VNTDNSSDFISDNKESEHNENIVEESNEDCYPDSEETFENGSSIEVSNNEDKSESIVTESKDFSNNLFFVTDYDYNRIVNMEAYINNNNLQNIEIIKDTNKDVDMNFVKFIVDKLSESVNLTEKEEKEKINSIINDYKLKISLERQDNLDLPKLYEGEATPDIKETINEDNLSDNSSIIYEKLIRAIRSQDTITICSSESKSENISTNDDSLQKTNLTQNENKGMEEQSMSINNKPRQIFIITKKQDEDVPPKPWPL
jgi:hypothetical protein